MSEEPTTNPKLRLRNILLQGKTPAIATFMMLKGARAAQVVANTGVDVSPANLFRGNN